MTLDELILYYDGIGYRESRIVDHRGSHRDGYINAKLLWETMKDTSRWYLGNEEATDWVGAPKYCKSRLVSLLFD